MPSSRRNARNVLAASTFMRELDGASLSLRCWPLCRSRGNYAPEENSIAREGFLPTFHFAFTGDLWPTRQINIQKTSTENFTSTINASTATSAGRPRPRITNETTTAATPLFTSNPSRPRKRPFARKQWKVVPLKPSVTTALSGVATGLWPVFLHKNAGELRSPSRPHHCRFRQQRRRRNSSGPENFQRSRSLRTDRHHVRRGGNTRPGFKNRRRERGAGSRADRGCSEKFSHRRDQERFAFLG